MAAVLAGAAGVVVAAATAAPAPTVAVATSSKLNVLFNFMAAFLNCCKRLLPIVKATGERSVARSTERSSTATVDEKSAPALFGGSQDSPGLGGMIQRPPDGAKPEGHVGGYALALDRHGLVFLYLGNLLARGQRLFQLVRGDHRAHIRSGEIQRRLR